MRQDVEGGGDERQVSEGLREVAELTARDGVVLLGEQPEIVRQPDQALEQGMRVVVPPQGAL